MTDDHVPRRTILAVCCAGMGTLSLMAAAPAMWLADIGAELAMNEAQKGLFLGAPAWGLLVAMLAAGPAADRWGYRLPMLIGVVLQVLGLVLIGLAGTQLQALAGGCVMGLGSGLGDALFTPVACGLYNEARSRVANLLHAFYPIGLIVTVLLTLLLMHLGFSWRQGFLAFALLPLPYGLAAAVLPLPRQSHQGPERTRVVAFLRHGSYLLFLGALLLACATELGPAEWLPVFVNQAAGDGRLGGGLGLALFGVTMGIGRLGTSVLVHRVGPRRLFVVGGVACAACLLLSATSDQSWLRALWLVLLGFGVAGFWPTIMACAGDRFPHAGATMYAILAAAGALGGFVGPAAIGAVAELRDLSTAMAALAVAPLVMAGLLYRVVGGRGA